MRPVVGLALYALGLVEFAARLTAFVVCAVLIFPMLLLAEYNMKPDAMLRTTAWELAAGLLK